MRAWRRWALALATPALGCGGLTQVRAPAQPTSTYQDTWDASAPELEAEETETATPNEPAPNEPAPSEPARPADEDDDAEAPQDPATAPTSSPAPD